MSSLESPESLFTIESWEVRGITHIGDFFRLIPIAVPYASSIELVGRDWPDPLADDYRLALETERFAVHIGEEDPEPQMWHYRIRANAEIYEAIAEIAECRIGRAICEALCVTHYGDPMLEWYDLPGAPVRISLKVSQSRIRRFCILLGAEFGRAAAAV